MASDHSLFDKIFLTYYPPLTAFAYRFVNDLDAAKDIVQSIFVKIYEKSDSLFLDEKTVKSYLYKAVSNACINHLKKEKVRFLHHDLYGKETSEDPLLDAAEQVEEEHRVYAAIKKLPPQCQKIFIMSYLDNLKNQEIADQLAISIRTVETQISNALRSLRKSLSLFLF